MSKLKLVDLIHASIFTGLDYCYADFSLLLRKAPTYAADPVLTKSKQTTSPSRSHPICVLASCLSEMELNMTDSIVDKTPGGLRHLL